MKNISRQTDEEHSRPLFDAVPDALFVLDGNGRILDANLAAVALYGYAVEELLQMSAADLAAPQLRKQSPFHFDRSINSGDRFDWIQCCKDGTEVPVEIHSKPIAYRGAAAILSSVRVARSRNVLLQGRQGTELKFSGMFPLGSQPASLTLFPSQVFVDVNDAWTALLGYSRSETVGRTSLELGIMRSAVARDQAIEKITRERLGKDVEVTVATKAGQLLTVLANIEVLTIDGKDYALSTIQDITEKRRNEAELRIAAAAFECQECMLVLDADARVQRVNAAFCRVTGYADAEVRGRRSGFLRSARVAESHYDDIWAEVERAGIWIGDVWHRRKDGSDYLAQGGTTAVRDAQGQVTHYVIHFIDGTRKRKDEEQRMSDELALRGTLVREVHHRIKNSLQGVIGLLRRAGSRNPATAADMNAAVGQVNAVSMVHGLLGRSSSAAVSVADLTSAIAQEVQSIWGVAVNVQAEPSLPACYLSEAASVPVALVLNELMVNAVKHGAHDSEGVTLALLSLAAADAIRVQIRNAGRFTVRAASRDDNSGLQLVAALMPGKGALLKHSQDGREVLATLDLMPPVIRQAGLA